MGDRPCFYCLNPVIHICICVACRTKLEKAKAEVDGAKKDMTFMRKKLFWSNRENMRLREWIRKQEKGKP